MRHEAAETSSEEASPSNGGERILIADDDPEIRELLAEALRLEGYQVELAADGRMAIDALYDRERRPALLLLDLMMPEMSGWDVLERLRDKPLRGAAVVLVLSAISDSAAPVPGVRWLRKPVSIDDLLAAVRASLPRCGNGATTPSVDTRPSTMK